MVRRWLILLAWALVVMACAYAARRPFTQRVANVYMVNTHLEWWQDAYARPADDVSFPKFVIVSDIGWACVMTTESPDYGRWASVLPREPFECPTRWRAPRRHEEE